jgi:hypothetical protein
MTMIHVYEVRPRKDKRGVDLISDALPFTRLWYGAAPNGAGGVLAFSTPAHRPYSTSTNISSIKL